jgi:hypothetical protein
MVKGFFDGCAVGVGSAAACTADRQATVAIVATVQRPTPFATAVLRHNFFLILASPLRAVTRQP